MFLGVSESCIICYCLILLVFLFVYLYLFGLKRGLKILFGLFWLPKSPLLPRSGHYRCFCYASDFFLYKTLPTGCIWIRESTLIPFLRFSMNLYSLTSVRNLVIFGIWVLFHLQNFCLKKFLFEKKGCVLGSKSFIFGQKCFIFVWK